MGRMNRFTFDYPFADVVENAVNPLFAGEPDPGQPLLVRGTRTPQDAFIILWSGGFNTWTNVNLLYEGLARAMEKDEKVYFASTGGSIDGHDEKTYAEFHRLLAASPFRKRFILLGWIKAEELFPLYCECDAGLNVDAMNYETMFGARNRITNMLAAGLPVLTTLGTEISRTVETERLGLAFPMDDPDLMAGAILDLAQNRVLCREMSVASRRYALENYSNSGTTQPLRDWVRNPKLAPDNQEKVIRYPSTDDLLSVWTNDIEKTHALLGDRDALSLVNDSRDLWIIRSNPLFKLYKSLKGVFKKK